MDALDDYFPASEVTAREHADYFVVSRGQRAETLHLPDPDSNRDSPAPLCNQLLNQAPDDLRSVEKSVFPPGHRRICMNCRQRLGSEE